MELKGLINGLQGLNRYSVFNFITVCHGDVRTYSVLIAQMIKELPQQVSNATISQSTLNFT